MNSTIGRPVEISGLMTTVSPGKALSEIAMKAVEKHTKFLPETTRADVVERRLCEFLGSHGQVDVAFRIRNHSSSCHDKPHRLTTFLVQFVLKTRVKGLPSSILLIPLFSMHLLQIYIPQVYLTPLTRRPAAGLELPICLLVPAPSMCSEKCFIRGFGFCFQAHH